MKIAVTGATGFIGQYVVAELEQRGLSATLACRSPSDLQPGATSHRTVALDLASLPDHPFEALGKPDVLMHLAWDGLPNYQSLRHFESELPSQYRFLKAMVAGGLPNLLVTGTCLEYGMKSGALHEELEPSPTTPYGYAKDALRVQLAYLQQEVPFRLTWARLFYLYGRGQAPTSLYSQLTAAIQRGDTLFNMSGGEQLRDYLPASIAARHLVSLALAGRQIGIVNVCSGNPISVRDMVATWIADNGWSIALNHGYYPYPDYEPMEFWGDARKMDKCLEPGVAS